VTASLLPIPDDPRERERFEIHALNHVAGLLLQQARRLSDEGRVQEANRFVEAARLTFTLSERWIDP